MTDSNEQFLPNLFPETWPLSANTRPSAMAPGATVSISDLRIPAAAARELQRYQKSFSSGDTEASIRHLERAIQIEPSILSAHQNLGLCFARLRQYDRAVAEFQSAAKLDKHLAQPQIGLAGVFFLEARYSDAEAAARRAVEIAPANVAARYLLARALMAQGHEDPETVELLQGTAVQYPLAHVLLGNILLKQNVKDKAIAEYREYLKQPGVLPEREKVQCEIEILSNVPVSSACGSH